MGCCCGWCRQKVNFFWMRTKLFEKKIEKNFWNFFVFFKLFCRFKEMVEHHHNHVILKLNNVIYLFFTNSNFLIAFCFSFCVFFFKKKTKILFLDNDETQTWHEHFDEVHHHRRQVACRHNKQHAIVDVRSSWQRKKCCCHANFVQVGLPPTPFLFHLLNNSNWCREIPW